MIATEKIASAPIARSAPDRRQLVTSIRAIEISSHGVAMKPIALTGRARRKALRSSRHRCGLATFIAPAHANGTASITTVTPGSTSVMSTTRMLSLAIEGSVRRVDTMTASYPPSDIMRGSAGEEAG